MMTRAPTVYRGRLNEGGLVPLVGALISYGLVYSHLMSFITSKTGIPSTPVYLLIIGLGVVMASGVFVCRSLTRSSMVIIAAIVAYVLLLLVSLLFLDKSAFTLTRDRLFWAMVAVSAIVLFSNLRNAKTFLLILRLVVLVSAVILIAEFASGFSMPVVMTTVKGRAGGLFENPNNAALFVSMVLPIVTIGLKPAYRAFWYGLSLTCIFLTFSRGGLALCALAILLVEVFPLQRGGVASMRRLFIGVFLVALAVPLYLLISTFVVTHFGSELDANTLARARIESDSSSDIRFYVLKLAWQEFAASPFWGHGTGAGDRWLAEVSVHNQFGLVAVEYGVIGLAWFGAFLAALWSIPRPFGIWAASLFVVGGMTNHNLTDGPTYALILATYAALPAIFAVQRSNMPVARPRARGRVAGGGPFRSPIGGPGSGNLSRPTHGAWAKQPPAGGRAR